MSEISANSEQQHSTATNPLIRAGVLRAPVLGSTLNHANNSTFGVTTTVNDEKEKETTLNPFMKAKDDEETNDDNVNSEGAANSTVFGTTSNNHKDTEQNDEEHDERPDPLTLLRKNGIERANLFAAAKSSIPRVENSGFVFGQNVHERVTGDNVKPDSSSKTQTADSTSGELLFSSVIQNASKANEPEEASGGSAETSSNDVVTTQDNETKSLTDVAREYEESRAQKRKFEEVQTFTGEENEVNIIDISCKLFAFVNSNWEERGRGSLRLNDSKTDQGCSRVVFRTSGNLRLLLNTKVWAGMVAERPSQKSLRLTAMDNTGKIKVFLAQARPAEINLLHKALVQRIDIRKASHPGECYADKIDNNENGSNEEEQNSSKNGAVSSSDNLNIETEQVDKLEIPDPSESDHEDTTEPSPKKKIAVEGEESNE